MKRSLDAFMPVESLEIIGLLNNHLMPNDAVHDAVIWSENMIA